MPRVLLRTRLAGQWLATEDPTIAVIGQQLFWGQIGSIYTLMHELHHDIYDVIVISRYISGPQVDVDMHSHIAARVLQDEHLIDVNCRHMCLHGVMGCYSRLADTDTVAITRKFSHMSCAELMISIDSSTTIVLTIALCGNREYLHGWSYDTRSGRNGIPSRYNFSSTRYNTDTTMYTLGICSDFVGCEYYAFVRHGDAMGDILSFARSEVAEIMLHVADDETKMILMSLGGVCGVNQFNI